MKLKSGNIPLSIVVSTLLMALFVDVKCLNTIFVAINESLGGMLMKLLYVVTIAGMVLWRLFSKKVQRKPSPILFVLVLYVTAFYFITDSFVATPRVPLLLFLVFTVFSLIAPSISVFNTRLLLLAIMIIPSFGILYVNQIFVSLYSFMDVISMGVSYSFLMPIIATVMYLAKYVKTAGWFELIIAIIATICNLVFFAFVLMYGSRGPILCVFSLVIILFIFKYNNNIAAYELSKRRLLFSIVGVFVLLALSPLWDYIFNRFSDSFHFIDKISSLLEEGDVSNGRSELTAIALKGFLSDPILGKGLDLFDHYNPGADYPHNFLLQLLYDGGIILFFIVILPSIRGAVRVVKKGGFDDFNWLTCLFSGAVVGALFSQDLWEISMLWMFVGFVLTRNKLASSGQSDKSHSQVAI